MDYDTPSMGRVPTPERSYPQASGTNAANHAGTPVDSRTYQEILNTSKGRFVVCRFLVGTQAMSSIYGILVNVGPSYFVIQDPCTGIETTCDIYSLKFISIYPEGVDLKAYCINRLYRTVP